MSLCVKVPHKVRTPHQRVNRDYAKNVILKFSVFARMSTIPKKKKKKSQIKLKLAKSHTGHPHRASCSCFLPWLSVIGNRQPRENNDGPLNEA